MGNELLLTTVPSDLVEHLMRFARHLVQGFVHRLDVWASISPTAPGGGGACARHAPPVPGGARRAPAPLNAKTVDIRAFARYVLLMPGMDQTHGEASIGQHLKHGNPQHPGGFQGYGVDPARLPPVSQGTAALGERGKAGTGWARLPTTPRYRYRSPPHAAAVPATSARLPSVAWPSGSGHAPGLALCAVL